MPRKRQRVLYSGRVQGVGFRFTCQRLSTTFPIVGYVRNLPEGSVELVADGDSEVVDRFLAAIRSEMGTKIRNVSVSVEEFPEDPESSFTIRD